MYLYNSAKAMEAIVDSPTTTQPVVWTSLFLNSTPKSQRMCRRPLIVWNVNGIAMSVFVSTFAAIGHAAKLAARLTDDRFHPTIGAIKYAEPKM